MSKANNFLRSKIDLKFDYCTVNKEGILRSWYHLLSRKFTFTVDSLARAVTRFDEHRAPAAVRVRCRKPRCSPLGEYRSWPHLMHQPKFAVSHSDNHLFHLTLVSGRFQLDQLCLGWSTYPSLSSPLPSSWSSSLRVIRLRWCPLRYVFHSLPVWFVTVIKPSAPYYL